MVWRVASSKHFSDTLKDIKENWTIFEIWQANEVLDAIELANEMAYNSAMKGIKD